MWASALAAVGVAVAVDATAVVVAVVAAESAAAVAEAASAAGWEAAADVEADVEADAEADAVMDVQPTVGGLQAVTWPGDFDTLHLWHSLSLPLAPSAIALRHGFEGSHRPTVVLGARRRGQSHLGPPLASLGLGHGGSGTQSPVEDQQERTGYLLCDDFHMSAADYAGGAAGEVHNAPVLKAPEHKAQPQG